jgi:hypothetical protein
LPQRRRWLLSYSGHLQLWRLNCIKCWKLSIHLERFQLPFFPRRRKLLC